MRIVVPSLCLALLAASPAVHAETLGSPIDTGCFASEIALADTLPANVRGIPISREPGMVTASLLAADGTEVPTVLVPDPGSSWSILTISKDLVPGDTYTVRWSDACEGMRARSFLAGPIAKLPTTAGVALVGETTTFDYAGACDHLNRPVGSVRRGVTLEPSPELKPFLAVSRLQLLVTGRDPSWPVVGTTSLPGSFLPCPSEFVTQFATVRVLLPDGTTVSTGEFKIDMACPPSAPVPCSDKTDSGFLEEPDFDASVIGGSPDAGSPPQDAPRAAAYGCATSGGREGGVGAALAVLAVLMARSRRSSGRSARRRGGD